MQTTNCTPPDGIRISVVRKVENPSPRMINPWKVVRPPFGALLATAKRNINLRRLLTRSKRAAHIAFHNLGFYSDPSGHL